MTAVFFSDFRATSPGGRFTLLVQTPDNGHVPRLDGSPAVVNPVTAAGGHQGDFLYRLVDNRDGRVVWKRRQAECSPVEAVVADDGWAVLRTHGFRPELIAVSPAGADSLRVKVLSRRMAARGLGTSTGPAEYAWADDVVTETSAGLYWTELSWRYFFEHRGGRYFAWRTNRGRRLVLALDRPALLADEQTEALGLAMREHEAEWATRLLADLAGRTEVLKAELGRGLGEAFRDGDAGLLASVRFLKSAVLLAGAHGLRRCVPFLRRLEEVRATGCWMSGRFSLGRGWSLAVEYLRPLVQHCLRKLGTEPLGFAAYSFIGPDRATFPAPECLADRPARLRRLGPGMSGPEVLALAGPPDHVPFIRRPSGPPLASWDYDTLADASWRTLRIHWEPDFQDGRIAAISEGPADWPYDPGRERDIIRG